MKKLTMLILAATCMLSSECLEKAVGTKHGIFMQNDTESRISIYGTYIQKDTLLPDNRPKSESITPSSYYENLPYDVGFPGSHIMSDTHDWLKDLSDRDTIRIFVFDYEQFENEEWSTIRDLYSILLRYDFTVQNLKDLNYRISYPPTPKMKDIKMWPPYEEAIKQHTENR